MDFHEAASIFPLDEEHIGDLAKDIKKQGLLCPIETVDGKIIDGRRRFMACKKAKVEPQFTDVKGLVEDPIAYVMSLNFHRRHLTVSQASMCAARARELYDQEAKQRQQQHGGTAPGKQKNTCGQLATSVSGKARDQAGQAFGVSGRTVHRAAKIIGTGFKALIDAVDSGKLSVSTGEAIAAQPEHTRKDSLKAALEKPPERSPKAKPTKQDDEPPPGESRGVGVARGNEAINCLKRIPKNDGLRKQGFQIVTDWIRHNK